MGGIGADLHYSLKHLSRMKIVESDYEREE
jgi:hypothetical protein